MKFTDVPNLDKFHRHVQKVPDCPITQDAYRQVKELIEPAPPPTPNSLNMADASHVQALAQSCAAIEKSNRIIWACAAATDHISPPMWDYVPDYQSVLEYFRQLPDLELMRVTHEYRIVWEQQIHKQTRLIMRRSKPGS
jgi:hypothetical protein